MFLKSGVLCLILSYFKETLCFLIADASLKYALYFFRRKDCLQDLSFYLSLPCPLKMPGLILGVYHSFLESWLVWSGSWMLVKSQIRERNPGQFHRGFQRLPKSCLMKIPLWGNNVVMVSTQWMLEARLGSISYVELMCKVDVPQAEETLWSWFRDLS